MENTEILEPMEECLPSSSPSSPFVCPNNNNNPAATSTTATTSNAFPACKEGEVPPVGPPTNKKKKKKRKKKNRGDGCQEEAAPHMDNDVATTTATPLPRPGKKKLRKLRYQQRQQQLDPTEILWNSARACQFTGSVVVLGSSENGRVETNDNDNNTNSLNGEESLPNDFASLMLPMGSKIQVRTSCCIPSFNAMAAPTDAIPRHTIIQVQPLLVLDLNGILCHRIRPHRVPSHVPRSAYRRPVADVAGTPVIDRPDLVDFLTYVDQHFCLAVWTSAKRKTARALVQTLVPPSIAHRLLFVWAQNKCDCRRSTSASNNNGDNSVLAEEEECVFEKNLAKVWQEYPLWNAHNTILMDDTPDKCQKWHTNAIHPPPLHGRQAHTIHYFHKTSTEKKKNNNDDDDNDGRKLLSDETNVQAQRIFFQGLVQRLSEQSIVTEWTVRGPPATASSSSSGGNYDTTRRNGVTTANGDDNNDKSPPLFELTSNPILQDHLRTHAVGHMGWV